MKTKLIALALAFVMLVSCLSVLSVSAATFTMTEKTTKAYNVTTGVSYKEYDLVSGVNGNTVVASALQFGTTDYMVMSYAGVSGGAANLADQYKLAKAEGYDVVAVINGDFFSMDYDDQSRANKNHGNYGYLNEYVVSNGVIVSAANDDPAADFGGMVAIGTDGSLTSVANSKLHFNMYFNGKEVNGGLGFVNKTGGCNHYSNWTDKYYYFDSHSGDKVDEDSVSKALTYEVCPGYEVLCKKLDNTELTVGGTLTAKVISVTENTYGGKIGEDEFILFVRKDSPFASQAASLKKDDPVTISASETVTESVPVIENAASVMANVGWLVKDGVNLTTDSSFNAKAAHSNTTQARWTAFGRKADGSWVFFTTEGASTGSNGSVTLQDVAAAMIKLGCKDVIRMDGGGSSAMYVCDSGSGQPGYKQSSTRQVGDCILLVRRTSEALKTSTAIVNEVKELASKAASSADSSVKELGKKADAIVKNSKSTYGEYINILLRLRFAFSGKQQLGKLMSEVAGVKFSDYSEFALNHLRTAYSAASAQFGSVSLSPDGCQKAYEELEKWYKLSGDITYEGKDYKKISTGIYLTGINLSILNGYSVIFTPGTDMTGMNLNWTYNILARYDETEKAYRLEKNLSSNGKAQNAFDQFGFNVVPGDCLVIAVHTDGTPGPATDNKNIAAKAKKGQYLVMHGIDLETKLSGVGAYFEFTDTKPVEEDPGEDPGQDPKPEFKPGDINGNGGVDAMDYMFIRSYYLKSNTKIPDEYVERMNLDGKPGITPVDVMLVRAIILGTYKPEAK